MLTRRQQDQATLRRDVLRAARAQLEAGGATALSWRGLAREVGVGPSTLYTYFAGVDELTTEVLVEAYRDMAAEVAAATVAAGPDPVARLVAGACAYRRWALANRARFTLLFTDVVPGYVAPEGGPTVAAQESLLAPLAEAVAEARGRCGADLAQWPVEDRTAALGLWGQIHGLVVLEVNHHLDWNAATGDVFADCVTASASRLVDEDADAAGA